MPDYSGIQSSINQGYDYQRQQARQQEGANLQGQRDALARRQAQLGGGPSGAFIAQERQAENDSAQRLQNANAGINQAQAADTRNLQMTQLGQQFQQGLQDQSIAAQKEMQQTGIGAQEQMQQAGFGQQTALQKSQQDFAASEQAKQLAQQSAQLEKQFGLSQQQFQEQTGVDQFNEHIAQQMADKKDILEKLLGPSIQNTGNLGGFFSNLGRNWGLTSGSIDLGGGGGGVGGAVSSTLSSLGI